MIGCALVRISFAKNEGFDTLVDAVVKLAKHAHPRANNKSFIVFLKRFDYNARRIIRREVQKVGLQSNTGVQV